MVFPGQRFVLDLGDNDVNNQVDKASDQPSSVPIASHALIGEIHERVSSAVVPSAPKSPSGSTGFPQPRQRVRSSAFRKRREARQQQTENPAGPSSASAISPHASQEGVSQDEKTAIDEENERHLASMSPAQIQQERAELMASLDPSLLERFLRRAKIDDDEIVEISSAGLTRRLIQSPQTSVEEREKYSSDVTPTKSVRFDESATASPSASSRSEHTTASARPHFAPFNNDDLPPAHIPDDLHPASEPPSVSFHFPISPPLQNPLPNLDPSSPSFLSDLQTHYFPEMSHDPSTLSWLQPLPNDPDDPEASTSAYHPSSTVVSVSPSALRFSLLGTLLSPSTALSLPTNLGLHHHGNDPQAAGYTISELALLSRSTFPPQRCIAWQVLGRILYRLGKGEFGARGSLLVDGLWDVIEKEAVVAGMLAEADDAAGPKSERKENQTAPKADSSAAAAASVAAAMDSQSEFEAKHAAGAQRRRHASAVAWALEGVWLWQVGGGGDRGLLKDGAVRSQ